MTDPLPRWDLFRPLDMLAWLWSTATAAPVSSGASTAYQTLFNTVRRLVVGRRITVRLDSGDVTLTVAQLESQLDLRSLSVGQLNDVRLAASDVRFDGGRFDRATVELRNVHIRPSGPPVLVAAPVDLTVEIPTDVLDEVFRWAAPRLTGDVGADGIARLRWARRPGAGHIEVDARLDGSTLWLRPGGIVVKGRRMTLPHRTPAYPVRLPDLGRGLRLTTISFAPGLICVSGTLPEWRLAIPRGRLEEMLNQLNVVGRPLSLSWLGLGR